MSMTKRDYEIVAYAFEYTKEQNIPSLDTTTINVTATFLANILELNFKDKGFDREKFLDLCGV